MKSALVI